MEENMCDLNSFIAANFWTAFGILVLVFLLGGIAILVTLGMAEDSLTRWIVTKDNFKLLLKTILTFVITIFIIVLLVIGDGPIVEKYPQASSVIAVLILLTIIIGGARFFVLITRIKKSLKQIRRSQIQVDE